MRFTVPFLLAIAVYVATVLGANQTSFTPNEDMLYDVVSASDALAFRLERALGIAEKPALMLGALLLTLPALLTFHLFRVGFGGSVQSLIQEDRMARQLAKEREQAQAARYATAGTPATASTARAQTGDGERRTQRDRRRGLGANIAAALKGRAPAGKRTDAPADSTSGTTSIGSAKPDTGDGASAGRLKDRWAGILDTKPDFSRLKSGAQNLREKITPRTGSGMTKLSLDDIADDAGNKSS